MKPKILLALVVLAVLVIIGFAASVNPDAAAMAVNRAVFCG